MKESLSRDAIFGLLATAQLRTEVARSPPELLHRDFYHLVQSLERKWLGQNIIGAIPGCECQQIRISRNRNYLKIGTRLVKLCNRIENVDLLHHDICNQDIWIQDFNQARQFASMGGGSNTVSFRTKRRRDGLEQPRVVVNEYDSIGVFAPAGEVTFAAGAVVAI